MKTAKLLKTLVLPVFPPVFLSGCYIPIRFDAEIEIHRTGAYDFKFDGYMASVELYKCLKAGEIDAAAEKKKIELIKTDFTRDPSVKEFKYFKLGHFKVNWHRNGDLIKVKSVSFFNSTSEYILGLRYNKKTRRITMAGKSLHPRPRKNSTPSASAGAEKSAFSPTPRCFPTSPPRSRRTNAWAAAS